MERDLKKFSQKILELDLAGKSYVVTTLTDVKGSAPQNLGARMIVDNAGEILFGTVGGGKVEARCVLESKEMFSKKEEFLSYTWNLQKDIHMTCGGVVSFMFERRGQSCAWNLVIFGAGHVSQALTRNLCQLSCNVTVVDSRVEWLNKLPQNDKLITIHEENMPSVLGRISQNSYVILMTKGHATDTPILEAALKNYNFPYLGVIGSLPKRNVIEKELSELGVPKDQMTKFYCPMGESFGNNSPEEISISIMAQLLRLRDSK
ncbi:MAG: xanthine dehydrogenase accessory factor [Bacteriovoracaceae bacterium]|jgi:xanthine dehydrogenase accessory factor